MKKKIHAFHLGKKLALREVQTKLGFKSSAKEPMIVEYARKRYVAMFRYGVVVFWNFRAGEMNEFLEKLGPFVIDPFPQAVEEEAWLRVGAPRDEVRGNDIAFTEMTTEKIAVVSLIFGRSVALDYYDREIQKVLNDFDELIQSLALTGRAGLSGRTLLKKIGAAMNIRHMIVHQMALLDKPDLAWEDPSLNNLYQEVAEDYEIEDRYTILNEKLQTIFHNVEFITSFLESKRTLTVEVIIVLLIVIEIAIFVYEVWFLK